VLLEEFQLKHTILPGEKPDSNTIGEFKLLLPEYLILIWEEFGFFSTEDRLIFLTNPKDFKFLHENKILSTDQIVFARTSFGDLFIWDKDFKIHYMVNEGVLFGNRTEGSQDIEIFFEISLNRYEYLDKVLYRKQHKSSIKKLGDLESDECFAFVPAFALGGSPSTSEIEKVKLREHLLFLSQLTGTPQRIGANVSSDSLDNIIDSYERENR
jgi:hypothetical protein